MRGFVVRDIVGMITEEWCGGRVVGGFGAGGGGEGGEGAACML